MIIVSRVHLVILRTVYCLLALGAGSLSWARLIDSGATFELMDGFAACMLASFSALCLVGIRRPLRMLPILFWEILWKIIWLARIALPAWRVGRIDAALMSNVIACAIVVVVIAVVPWRYAWATYMVARQSPRAQTQT